MTRTGIVMKLGKNYACIMTDNGEFLKVRIKEHTPKIGAIYTGKVICRSSFLRYASVAACAAIIALSLGFFKIYYTASASVVVTINPSVRLGTNRWGIIIKTEGLNEDGKKLLASVKIKNKQLNEGLNLLVKEAVKENYVTEDYYNNKLKTGTSDKTGSKNVDIYVEKSPSKNPVDFTEFEKYMNKEKINYDIKLSKYEPEKHKEIKDNNSNKNDNSQKINGQSGNPGKGKGNNSGSRKDSPTSSLKKDKISNNVVEGVNTEGSTSSKKNASGTNKKSPVPGKGRKN